MIKTIFVILLHCVSIIACAQNTDKAGATDTTRWPVIKENAAYIEGWTLKDSVNTILRIKIKALQKGNGTVFQFRRNIDPSRALDDESNEFITWQITEEKNSFEIYLDSTSQIGYLWSNNWIGMETNARSISGIIKGVKQNNEWLVTGSIDLIRSNKNYTPGEPREQIHFSTTFKREFRTNK